MFHFEDTGGGTTPSFSMNAIYINQKIVKIPGRGAAWYIAGHHGSVWLWPGSPPSTWLSGGAELQASVDIPPSLVPR